MTKVSLTTIISDSARAEPTRPEGGAALAQLAFGLAPSGDAGYSMGPRHLAFLPADALELDLSDPAQRHFADYELIEKLGSFRKIDLTIMHGIEEHIQFKLPDQLRPAAA